MKLINLTLVTLQMSGFLLSILLIGCATTEKSSEDQQVKSHYTLEMGETVVHTAPLPVYYPFWLTWYQGSQVHERFLKYRGWDFNHDEKIDYLEELDADGKIVAHHFDFNLDGKLDLSR